MKIITRLLLITVCLAPFMSAEEIISAEDIELALTPTRSMAPPKERSQSFSSEVYRQLNPGVDPATRGIRIVANDSGQTATVTVNPAATLSFDNIRFKLDSTDFADSMSERQLEEIAKALARFEGKSFILEGHTCDLGAEEHNQKLSENRALAVGKFLRLKGVKCELVPFGYGEREPKEEGTSEETRQQNRRVVVRLKN